MTSRKEERPTISKDKHVIVTAYIFPPIPSREYDWQAAYDGYEEGDPLGHGATETEAMIDLLMKWEESE